MKESSTEEQQVTSFDFQETDDTPEHFSLLGKKPPKKNLHYQFPNYFYAGFWMRLFAFLVDLLLIACLKTILLGNVLGMSANGLVYTIGALICYLGYFIFMTKLTNGQTIGKMIFGLKVVCFNEEKLSWTTVLIREGACRIILKKGFFMIGYLVAAFSPKKQHIGDMFSDTSVVSLNLIKAYQGLEA
ncbi:hypothetical protein CBF29_09150 [Vagococcus elongatus]|uniref:RDD domain-containing protein n=2 Tax=Vagococcus elongatus TaxID=180344 RepID=A0A430ARU1_9ENTE|nr:hypothetical protein CBF29_09150 [Vagococcus elongatus]